MPKSPTLRALMQSPVGILGINWIFQGMRGMQRKELSFRVLLELVVAFLVFFVLHSVSLVVAVVMAFVVAHTFNWVFNTHLWVCVRYFPIYRRDPSALVKFMAEVEQLLRKLAWLNEAVYIGSVGDSGEVRSERSDIDLRIIFPQGIVNWLRVNLLLLWLRSKALIRVIPLDLYAYDCVDALDRFRQDENLCLVLDRQGRIATRYPHRIVAAGV